MAIKSAKASKRRKPEHKHRPIDKKLKKKKGKSSKNPNFIPLGNNPLLAEKKEKKEKKGKKFKKEKEQENGDSGDSFLISTAPAARQLQFFLHHFQSANGFKLSPLELEAFKDTCMVELSQSMGQDVNNLSEHMKATFEDSWKDVLCDGKLLEGKVDAGCPAVIIISSSALRSLDLLRGLKTLTRECHPAKLFAKHMKVEEQVSMLKGRVNIACGTPSRIKKLLDMDALLLSRLQVIVLDMQRDAKGYSLLTLPQVSTEFWDLYRTHFNERLLQGHTRICFYGPLPSPEINKICQGDN